MILTNPVKIIKQDRLITVSKTLCGAVLFLLKLMIEYGGNTKQNCKEGGGKHGGTLICHLLQDLKIPGSNLDKD